ncbi:hypothetical protein KBC70_04185 [Candidatus Woesebacteria bacterium]|nr:hypothetical protein [Candidatus Woesebacteria bacterium]
MSSQSIALLTVLLAGIIFSGFSIGQSIAKPSNLESTSKIAVAKPASSEIKKETLFTKVFGEKEEEPTTAPTTNQEDKKTSPTSIKKTTTTSKNNTTNPTSGSAPTTAVVYPTTIPSSAPTSTTVYSTPLPTTSQASPTTVPTSVPSSTATIQVDALWNSGSSDQPVYRGIVKIKDANSGTTLAQGTTSSSGRITFSNVPANRKIDAILLQPTDWQTEYCGDKQTFDLSAGQFKGLSMRIRPQGSSPCEH